jgi:hypothetical protein
VLYDAQQIDSGRLWAGGHPMNKNLATLTPEEEKAWQFAFWFWKDCGMTNARADHNTWEDLQAGFPRLRQFDGITE